MQKTDGRAAGQAVGGPAGGRIYLMDELRGFAVFCMVFYLSLIHISHHLRAVARIL